MVSYLTVNAAHPDFPALNMLSQILGSGRTSRLYKKLVLETEKGIWAGSYIRAMKYPSGFTLYAYPIPGVDSDSLLPMLDEEIAKLVKEPPSWDELNKVKQRTKSEFIFSLTSNNDLARSLATYQGVRGTLEVCSVGLMSLKKLPPKTFKGLPQNIFLQRTAQLHR
jgi:predicted Zn-dependent peptidase